MAALLATRGPLAAALRIVLPRLVGHGHRIRDERADDGRKVVRLTGFEHRANVLSRHRPRREPSTSGEQRADRKGHKKGAATSTRGVSYVLCLINNGFDEGLLATTFELGKLAALQGFP